VTFFTNFPLMQVIVVALTTVLVTTGAGAGFAGIADCFANEGKMGSPAIKE
jgi:hypothetical protein